MDLIIFGGICIQVSEVVAVVVVRLSRLSRLLVSRGTQLTDHILIGTPGKLLDWGTKLRCFDLSKVEVFVLDEADVMIATQGHQDQSIRIHKYVTDPTF